MLDWAKETGMPVHCVLTKADKFNRGPAQQELFKVRKLLAPWGDKVSVQLFSSLSKQGVDELAAVLDSLLTV
jgi:GTP-binding protein